MNDKKKSPPPPPPPPGIRYVKDSADKISTPPKPSKSRSSDKE